MPSGGDIIEITCNHPDLGSITINPKSAEDSTYDLGGVRTNDDNNSVQANGEAIYQMNYSRPSFAVKIGWNMVDNAELEYLSACAASTKEGQWTFTNINNVIYALSGKPVGDISGNGNASTIDLKVSGSGTLAIL